MKQDGDRRKPIRLDNVVEVPGGVVGIDPNRRWGPIVRWTVVVLEAPVRGVNWRPFDKRDVVVTDWNKKHELYREGPFSSRDASRRQQEVIREIKTDGLATFLRQRQIEESTIGPVSAASGRLSWAQEATLSVRLWWKSLRGGS